VRQVEKAFAMTRKRTKVVKEKSSAINKLDSAARLDEFFAVWEKMFLDYFKKDEIFAIS
jgi:arginyl-tRNA--protein-N-Asp/Glu arginylyltransferase